MPEESVPSFQDLLWPTLEALKALGGSGSIREIDDKLTEIAGISDSQRQVLHGDGPQSEVSYRAAWTRSYLKAVGALENSERGVWRGRRS
jgi:restriction system protein